jgi:hypothetical protein
MQDYTLKSETAEAMQASLLALGFEWDGTSSNARINGYDFAFFGTVSQPNPEDPETPIIVPGFHADAVGPAGFDFGALEIQVSGTRYHTWG